MKTTLSLIAALALSVGASRVARADSKTNDEINAAEAGNPDSIDYPNRPFPTMAPTQAELDALEEDIPANVNYANRPMSEHKATNAEIGAAEQDNPASVDYPNRHAGQ